MIYEDEETIDETDGSHDAPASRDGGVGTVALAVIAGAAIGAAVALMLAPRSGRETRKVLRRGAEDLRASASDALEGTRNELGREFRRRSRQVRRKLDRMA